MKIRLDYTTAACVSLALLGMAGCATLEDSPATEAAADASAESPLGYVPPHHQQQQVPIQIGPSPASGLPR